MQIHLTEILALVGIDLKHPLKALPKLLSLVPTGTLAYEMKAHVTDARRAELAADLRAIADDMDKSDFNAAAAGLIEVLSGIG